jgi:hypothetical protein
MADALAVMPETSAARVDDGDCGEIPRLVSRPAGLARSASTSVDRLYLRAAPSCSRRPSVARSRADRFARRSRVGLGGRRWTCASSSWSPRCSSASWPRCCGRWPPRAKPAWRPWSLSAWGVVSSRSPIRLPARPPSSAVWYPPPGRLVQRGQPQRGGGQQRPGRCPRHRRVLIVTVGTTVCFGLNALSYLPIAAGSWRSGSSSISEPRPLAAS